MKHKKSVKSILVGVDFSKSSKDAVQEARFLAKKWKVPLTIVHVFEDVMLATDARDMDVIEYSRAYYKKLVERTYKVSAEEHVIVKWGESVDGLLRASREVKNPLIVVGYGRHGFLSRAIIGSTAAQVAQKSRYPVLIHRGKANVGLDKVLIPSDLSEGAPKAMAFAKDNNIGKAKMEFFHVLQPPVPILDYEVWMTMNENNKKENSKLVKKFKAKNPKLKLVEMTGDVFPEIEKRSKNFDCVAISPRPEKDFWGRFGKINSKIVNSSTKPVLVVP